jgi:hypothetical protein
MRFDRAYKEARDNGEKTFEFEGKSYTTRMAGEGSSAYGKNMSAGARNKGRASEDAAGGEEIRAAGRAKTAESEDMAAGSDMAASAARNSSNTINQPDVVTAPKTGIVPRRYGTVRTGEGGSGDGKPFFSLNSEMPQKRYGTVRTGEGETSSEEGYKKGGMVKKKSSGMVSMKSGGAVRGAGIAQRGRGKMRMC